MNLIRQIAFGICVLSCARALLGDGDSAGTVRHLRSVMDEYCADCHNSEEKKGNLNLENIAVENIAGQPQIWEKVVRRLRARQMPPAGKKRPEESIYTAILTRLESSLEDAAAQQPNPGRTDTLRRLNRTEYQNAIRDLLALEIDAAALLPKEEGSHGFDNVTVGTLSPTLLDRYISAAQKISRLAVGAPRRAGGDTIRLRADLTQEEHVEGLPLGTRWRLDSLYFPAGCRIRNSDQTYA
jgi:hypothetical protein